MKITHAKFRETIRLQGREHSTVDNRQQAYKDCTFSLVPGFLKIHSTSHKQGTEQLLVPMSNILFLCYEDVTEGDADVTQQSETKPTTKGTYKKKAAQTTQEG